MRKEVIDEYALITEADKVGIERLVVGALLVRKSRVLLLRRNPAEFMGGMFELPSGQVEEGETLKGALKREVKEETGLAIKTIQKYLGSFDYKSGSGKPTRQFNFNAEPFPGKPKPSPTEHDMYQWIGPQEIHRINISDNVDILLRVFWEIK
jgi:8-oxo-dGTP diphosphatase